MRDTLEVMSQLLSSLQKDFQFLEGVNAGLEILSTALKNGKKILVAGNGGSATQASHMVGELIGRFRVERQAIPAISLFDLAATTAIGNDYGYDRVFSRFVEGLGNTGDILFSLSTSGESKNCLEAMRVAKTKGMVNIALLGKNGGTMKQLADCAIVVSYHETSRIQEVHLMVIHWLCEHIEMRFARQGV